MAPSPYARRRDAAVLTLAAAALSAACTGGADPLPDARAGGTPAAEAPSAEPSATEPPGTVPLALAVHPSRGPLDLTAAAAADVLAGRVTDWSELGYAPAPLLLVSSRGTPTPPTARRRDPRDAVRLVSSDPNALALVSAAALGPSVRAATVGGRHPLRAPARYPLTLAGMPPPEAADPVTVTFAGDVMLARRVASRSGGDPAAPLRPTARRLAGADLTVANLESTLSIAGRPRQGDDSFGADPAALDGLRLAGVDVLSLANNHTGDYGARPLVETVERVRAAGISPVGAGASRAEARQPVVVERGGVRFGFLAFNAIGETPAPTATSPGAVRLRMPPRTGPLHAGDLAARLAEVRRLADVSDVVVVMPHWGEQYTNEPVAAQRQVARALTDAGADLVVGAHPHVVQGVELHGGRFVAHSLGNYVFDMDFSQQTMQGMLLELVYWGPELKAADLVPVRMGADFAPRVVRGAAGREILAAVWPTSGAPFRTDP